MNSISVNKFRDNLKSFVDQSFNEHQPLKVTRRNAQDFVVMSADDYAREQETLYVLQNNDLMAQIAKSLQTHLNKTNHKASTKQVDEILSI